MIANQGQLSSMFENLAKRSLQSSAYNITASLIQMVVQFVRLIILVRLLPPEVFGAYRYAASIVIWTAAFPSFGMAGALVHRARESQGEIAFRVHFTLNLIFNLIWALALSLIGLLIFDSSGRMIFWVLIATQLVNNLNQTSRFKLVRQVSLRRIAVLNIMTTIVASIAAVSMAWSGLGVWSLVSTDVAAALVTIIGFYLYHPVWVPKLGWSREVARYLLDFGRRSVLAGPLMQTLDRIDDVWTGYFLGDVSLGFYSRAYRFASYPGNLIGYPIYTVATGTYAELKGRTRRLSQFFTQINALIIRAGFFIGGLMVLTAPEFVRIVMGPTWIPIISTFRLMLIYTVLDPVQFSVSSLFTAIGLPEKTVRARVIQLIILVIGLFTLGRPFGIEGVAIAVDIMAIVGLGFLLWHARQHVYFSLNKLLFLPALGLIAGLALGRLAIQIPGVLGSPWRSGFVKLIVFCTIYLGFIITVERQEMISLLIKVKQLYTAS
jgi:O-antigen/teichoic acid export membrane protein